MSTSSNPQNSADQKWFFATNQKNLAYLLASGLLLAKAGFGKKYYTDALNRSADYLPLFRNTIPGEALEVAVEEKSSLFAVVLELDLSQLTGSVLRPQLLGGLEEIQFPQALESADAQIFVKAPLPTQWINRIIVAGKDQKTILERDAAELLNVPLLAYKIATNKILLKGSKKDRCRLEVAAEKLPSPLAGIGNVVGGILGALSLFTDTGADAVAVNRLAFDVAFTDWQLVSISDGAVSGGVSTVPAIDNTVPADDRLPVENRGESGKVVVADPMFASLPRWMQQQSSEGIAEGGGALLFWSAIDALVLWHSNERSGAANDAVLNSIEQTMPRLSAAVRDHASQFLDDLRDVNTLGDSTVEHMMDAHATPMRRSFLLLLLVKNVDHLVTLFTEKRYPSLTLSDYLAAAILTGARQGWQATSVAKRGSIANSQAIQHRMVLIAHQANGSAISLGNLPPREPALNELLLANSSGKFTSKQQQAAVMLSRALGWACVETRITLPDTQVEITSKAGKLSLTTKAEVQVDTIVNVELFSTLLDSLDVDQKLLEKTRGMLV